MGFTAEGGYEEIQVVSCWMSKHGNYYLYLLAALNILLSIIASLGNILILVALWKVHSLHPPSKLLFRCLTVTDLLVGVFSQPLFASQLIFIAHKQRRLCFTTVSCNEVAGGTFSTVSLLTLTASYQHRQTSRSHAGTKLQVQGDFETNAWNCVLLLDCKHFSLQFTAILATCTCVKRDVRNYVLFVTNIGVLLF